MRRLGRPAGDRLRISRTSTGLTPCSPAPVTTGIARYSMARPRKSEGTGRLIGPWTDTCSTAPARAGAAKPRAASSDQGGERPQNRGAAPGRSKASARI